MFIRQNIAKHLRSNRDASVMSVHRELLIIWHYDCENPRSYEMAEEFRDEVTFPFEIEAME